MKKIHTGVVIFAAGAFLPGVLMLIHSKLISFLDFLETGKTPGHAPDFTPQAVSTSEFFVREIFWLYPFEAFAMLLVIVLSASITALGFLVFYGIRALGRI